MGSRPIQVIGITGGKGGVGKTNVSVNLAVSLAKMGRRVMLMDADLGLANVDVLLGLHAKANLSHVFSGEAELRDILLDGPGGIKIVPASSGTQHMTQLSNSEHAGLIRGFSELAIDTDVLIVDTAAGISDTVVNFLRACQHVVMVVCDEPTSITDAYALMKLLERDHGIDHFRILANMIQTPRQGQELFVKLSRVTDRFLDVGLQYMGGVPFDMQVRQAVRKQKAVVDAYPSSQIARAFGQLAKQVDNWPIPTGASGHMEFFLEQLLAGNQ
ncbi:MinD/ParA family protein [Pelagibaculum spongiae]|uniref:Cobyrinic acid a,c-diamide synthase n=1 Tax=Pelagibaculum spongiae TaxID=2080658 RepID=A0A2V1GR70_9GAMM|nr:MinD/ParA family protein [Pelagibaculum spongiae]PVZ66809.1 cobyrinic acid a,c-diamide synthase [Pelagibaculum spongiae]